MQSYAHTAKVDAQTSRRVIAWTLEGEKASPLQDQQGHLAPCLRLIGKSPGRWPLLEEQPQTSHAPSAAAIKCQDMPMPCPAKTAFLVWTMQHVIGMRHIRER